MNDITIEELMGKEVKLELFPYRRDDGNRAGSGRVDFGHVLGEYEGILLLESTREGYLMEGQWPIPVRVPRYYPSSNPRRRLIKNSIQLFPKDDIVDMVVMEKTPQRRYSSLGYTCFEGREVTLSLNNSAKVNGILMKDVGPVVVLEDALEQSTVTSGMKLLPRPDLVIIPSESIRTITTLTKGKFSNKEYEQFYGRPVQINVQTSDNGEFYFQKGIIVKETPKTLIFHPFADSAGERADEEEKHPIEKNLIRYVNLLKPNREKKSANLTLAVDNGNIDDNSKIDDNLLSVLRNNLYAHLKVNPGTFSPRPGLRYRGFTDEE